MSKDLDITQPECDDAFTSRREADGSPANPAALHHARAVGPAPLYVERYSGVSSRDFERLPKLESRFAANLAMNDCGPDFHQLLRAFRRATGSDICEAIRQSSDLLCRASSQ